MSWKPGDAKNGGFRSCACYGRKASVPDDDNGTEAAVFGEKAGYWEQYNFVTDKWDADMMDRLNTGLDNLLIFVSPHA